MAETDLGELVRGVRADITVLDEGSSGADVSPALQRTLVAQGPLRLGYSLHRAGVQGLDISSHDLSTPSARIRAFLRAGADELIARGHDLPDLSEPLDYLEGATPSVATDRLEARTLTNPLRSRVLEDNVVQVADAGADIQSWITPRLQTAPSCNLRYEGNEDRFPTEVKDTGDVTIENRRLGIGGLSGPVTQGPYESFDAAVVSSYYALRRPLVESGLVSMGTTIFEGENGYYHSKATGLAGLAGNSLPRSGGLFSGVEAISSVVIERSDGIVADHVGNPYIKLDPPDGDYTRFSDDDAYICYE